MHVDHGGKILYDSYIIEFDYDPSYNYYERGKYGCRNFHVIKFPLVPGGSGFKQAWAKK